MNKVQAALDALSEITVDEVMAAMKETDAAWAALTGAKGSMTRDEYRARARKFADEAAKLKRLYDAIREPSANDQTIIPT